MKTIKNPEIEIINLECNDILCGPSQPGYDPNNNFGTGVGVGSRYDDEEEEW